MSAIMFATRNATGNASFGKFVAFWLLSCTTRKPEPPGPKYSTTTNVTRVSVGDRKDAGVVEHRGAARRSYAQAVVRAGCDGRQIGCLSNATVASFGDVAMSAAASVR